MPVTNGPLRAVGSAALDPESLLLGVVSVFRIARDKARVGPLSQIQTVLSGLPHSFSGTAESGPDRLAELTPILKWPMKRGM
jgi:hypothetical protein